MPLSLHPGKPQRIWALKISLKFLLFVGTCAASAQTPVNAEQGYLALAGYKAQAIYSTRPAQSYFSAAKENKLMAATAALDACTAANPIQTGEPGYCELIRLDEQRITTAAMIKSRIPTNPHPLFLWRYRHGDTTVYLGGSVHILKPGLYPLPDQYQQAFDATQRLVLEVNLSAYSPQQMQAKALHYGLLPDALLLQDLIPSEMHARLAAITRQYGLPLEKLGRYKPSFVTQQLAMLALMSVGYDPGQGVETYFTRQAQNKEILELESIDFQLDLLMNQPIEVQVAMIEDILAQIDQFEPFTADLITAWLSGDDAAFEQAFDAQAGASAESQAFMRALIDERNVGMVNKIADYLQGQGSYFVLVGAGHYIGDNSIIKLLEHRGIQGQRIYSDQTISP